MAGGAHAAPAGPARSQRNDVDSAMTTSVQAQGKSSPDRATCPLSDGRFPGSRRQVPRHRRNALTFPGRLCERRTIRRDRGVQPRLIAKEPSGFSDGSPAPCRGGTMPPARRRFHRPIVPRHSTVAGSAVIAVPGLGPPCHVPFSPGPVCGRREPSDGRMIKRAPPPSQSSGGP